MKSTPKWHIVSFSPYKGIVGMEVKPLPNDGSSGRGAILSWDEFRKAVGRPYKRDEIMVEDWVDTLRSPGTISAPLKITDAGLERSGLLRHECVWVKSDQSEAA
jgi:hypothetical protein